MGTKRPTELRPTEAVAVDRVALAAALTSFVTRFVVDDKRKQMHARLLTAERRVETLAGLARWLAGTRTELAGADRAPAGIEARFGELSGVYLDEAGAKRTTIRGALERGRATLSLWIGDSGRIALLMPEGAAPILCSWP